MKYSHSLRVSMFGILFVVALSKISSIDAECPLPPASPKCKPLPTSCDLLIDQIKKTKECLIREIEETKICIESLNPCDKATTISAPTNIVQSGYYCLIEDLDVSTGPAISVADGVRNVVIDLNNHTITGTTDVANGALIDVVGNSVDIKIINGIVKPLGTDTTGIRIQNSSNVALSNLVVEGNNDQTSFGQQRGVNLVGVRGFIIDSCSITKIGGRPVIFGQFFANLGCEIGKITHCSFFDNDTPLSIVLLESCINLFFEDVDCSNNKAPVPVLPATFSSNGFAVMGGSSNIVFSRCRCSNNINRVVSFLFRGSSDCFCQNCEANQNVRTGDRAMGFFGFLVEVSSKIIFDSCIANNNSIEDTQEPFFARGFVVEEDSDACCVINCLAKRNEGVELGGVGFVVEEGSNAYLWNNVAIGNTEFGYEAVGSSIFFGNYAEDNSTNYSVSTNNAPRFTYDISTGTFTGQGARLGGTVTGWDNIDAVP